MRRFIIALCLLLIPAAALAQSGVVLKQQFASNIRNQGGCYSAAPLPMDAQASGTFTAAYGTCALTNKWLNGKLFDVTAQSRTVTIKAINGYPDTIALANLMGISPTSGIGGLPLSKWYDQSGNGNDCTQATAGNQFSLWLVNGKVSVAGDGVLVDYINSFGSMANADRFCVLPAGVATNNRALSFYAVSQLQASGNAFGSADTYNSTLFNTGASGATGFTVSTSYYGGAQQWKGFDWVGFSEHTTTLFPETQPVVMGVISSAAALTITQNEESATASATIPAGTATGGYLGGAAFFSLNSGFYGQFQAALIAGATALSSGNQTIERNSLYARFGIAKMQNYSILVDGGSTGNSTGSLVGGVNGYGWDNQVRAMTPYPIRWANTAIYGATIENLTTNFATSQGAFYSASYTKNLLWFDASAAGNSASAGDTAAQAYTALGAYVAKANTAGWTNANIYANTFLGTAATGAFGMAYDALLVANTLGINVVGPSEAGAPGCPMNLLVYGSVSSPIYWNQSSPYVDHPTVTGYNVSAKCAWPQLIQQAIGP